MFCSKCGENLPDDASFCANCGAAVKAVATQAPAPDHPAHTATQGITPKKRRAGLKITLAVAVLLVVAAGFLLAPHAVLPGSHTLPSQASKSKPAIPKNQPVNGIRLSTTERPSIEDFRWYLDDVEKNGVPKGVTRETDFNNLAANWKCLFIYDPEGTDTGRLYDFLTLTLSGAEGNGAVILDWSHMFAGDEDIDETRMEDTVLNMNWKNGTLYGYCPMNLSIRQFYSYNGAQYAVGTLTLPDGTEGLVAMTRP